MARPRRFDEDDALRAATELFWERGYAATSITDLEQHLGLGRQSIYNVLGGKRALFLKALAAYRRSGDEMIAVTLLNGTAGMDDLRRYFSKMVEHLTACTSRRACLMVNTVMENATADADIGAACRGSHKFLVHALEATVARCIERGEFPPGTDIATTATMIAAQAYGLSVLTKAGVPAKALKRAAESFLGTLP